MEYVQPQISKLYKAFEADGFKVKERLQTESGKVGIMAEHATAVNYDTGKKKVCYYLEGTPYERGYLMGLLAEPDIADMAVNFVDNIIFDFIGLEFLNHFPFLQKLIAELLFALSLNTWISQPKHVREEVNGMIDGCKKNNPNTRVTKARLSVMNVSFDVLCALIYTGNFLRERAPQITPDDIRLAMMCNAFSVFGEAAGGGHYFGRDFMFSTGSTLQNHLAHIINRPDNAEGDALNLYPFVSIAAPGIIGSVSAMNLNCVAAGLNMSPAANCDTEHIGFNSLLLLRECIMRGKSADRAAKIIQNAKRGVTWNYALSDGTTDTACTVEAGASWPSIDFLSYPQKTLLPYLPNAQYLAAHPGAPLKNGAMVRWCSEPFPQEYFSFNPGLWQYYKEKYDKRIRLRPDAFLPFGFINRTPKEKNCPSSFYFAPRRTEHTINITTNHFLLPHMRLCAMDPWCAQVVKGNVNDIQWRYDELNYQIGQTLLKQGSISYRSAKQLVDFLAPYGKFPGYYQKNPKSRNAKAIRIEGCVSLFDLKKCSVESHYGYYADEWVKTTLPNYFD